MKWTGRSIFRKSSAPEADVAVVENSGAPITPGTTLALRAGLAGMRTQLARAQRSDPRLAQIISHLSKETAGTYLAEPRGPEMRKVAARAYNYRLTNDKVLVAK